MSNTKDMTLTSVKVKSDLFENFKIECVKRKFSFICSLQMKILEKR